MVFLVAKKPNKVNDFLGVVAFTTSAIKTIACLVSNRHIVVIVIEIYVNHFIGYMLDTF